MDPPISHGHRDTHLQLRRDLLFHGMVFRNIHYDRDLAGDIFHGPKARARTDQENPARDTAPRYKVLRTNALSELALDSFSPAH